MSARPFLVHLFIGVRFLWAPAVASSQFGIPNSPPLSTGFTGWLATKGTRDIVSGLFIFLLMANGSPRLLGEFLLVASGNALVRAMHPIAAVYGGHQFGMWAGQLGDGLGFVQDRHEDAQLDLGCRRRRGRDPWGRQGLQLLGRRRDPAERGLWCAHCA